MGALVSAATVGMPAPTIFMSRALVAALAQRSVHYTLANSPGSGAVWHYVADVGRNAGTQRITFERGGKTGHVVIVVVAHTVYLRGDEFALNQYQGYHQAASKRYAGRWIRITASDPDYKTLAEDVTLASTIDDLRLLTAESYAGSRVLQGQQVVGIAGTSTYGACILTCEDLYVRAHGAPLPVAERMTANSTVTWELLSKWNEPVRVRAPARAIDIARTGLE